MTTMRARPRSAPGTRASKPTMAAILILLAVAMFLLGRALAPTPAPTNPIENIDGTPAGIEHTAAGALAAADSYLSVEQQNVERDPARETRLIEIDDAPSYRSADLRSAAAVRASDPTGMRFWAHGGHAVWVLGARRLDAYDGTTAEVSAWDGSVYWGGGRATPGPSWGIDHLSLTWWRPNRRLGRRSDSVNSRPQPPHACGK